MKKLPLLLLPFLAACGKQWMVVQEEPIDPPGTDEARVVVYRESFRNPTKPYAFLDDEEVLGFAQVGKWFEVRVAPGEHFFVLHGVTSSGVRATLEAGKTYFLRVDSVPTLLELSLRLTPIVPGMEEFDNIFKVMVELKRCEPIEGVLKGYAEQHADDLEAAVASLKTDRLEQCPILPPDAGR
jgi:hypothetical protein